MYRNLEKSIALDKEILSNAFGEDFFVTPQEDKDFKYLLTLVKEKNGNKKNKRK